MAYIKIQPRTQIKTGRDIAPITLDGGANRDGTIFNIGKNEAWDCLNTTSRVNGALSVKPADTSKVTNLYGGTNPFSNATLGMLGINSYTTSGDSDIINILCKSPDETTKYVLIKWNPIIGGMYALYSVTPLLKFSESTIIYIKTDTSDYIIICNDDGVYETHDDGTTFTLIANAPKTPIYCYDDNRLFALKGNKLSWCDPFDITNWTTGDSGNVTITEMRGNGTAIVTMNDAVYCFSNKTMHILYGDDTGDYKLISNFDHGCVSFRAIAAKDNSIYFLDFDGLKVYNSGQVNIISDKISYWLKKMYISFGTVDAVIAINDNYLYLTVRLRENSVNFTVTFELNLDTGVWNKWDESYIGFTKVNNKFYGLKYTGLYEIGTNNTHSTSWHHETPMNFAGFNKQTISSLPILLDLPVGSTLKLAYNLNANAPSWNDLYTFTPNVNVQSQLIHVPMNELNNVEYYQLKLYGTGPCTVHYMGEDKRVRIR